MRTLAIVTALAALPFVSAADRWPTQPQAVVQAPAQRYSQEKLQRIRQSLAAQIAVRDEAEGAMRAPTADEAAAFAVPSGGAPEIVALGNGGLAIRVDASQLSLSVAQIHSDGSVRLTHGAQPGSTRAAAPTGGTNDR